jgi:hypothetical protein
MSLTRLASADTRDKLTLNKTFTTSDVQQFLCITGILVWCPRLWIAWGFTITVDFARVLLTWKVKTTGFEKLKIFSGNNNLNLSLNIADG